MDLNLKFLSPLVITFISLMSIFLITLTPPNLFISIIYEPANYYLNLNIYLMLIIIYFSFYFGYKVHIFFFSFKVKEKHSKNLNGVLLTIYYLFFFVWFITISNLNFYNFILNGTLSVLRENLISYDIFGFFSFAVFFQVQLFFIIFLVFSLRKKTLFFKFTVLLYFLTTLFLGYRFILFPLVVSLLVNYVFINKKTIKLTKILFIPILIIIIFSISSFFRSGEFSSSVFNYIFGYTTAPINKLSLILEGKLVFPFSGNFFYLFRSIYNLPIFGNLFGTNDFFSSLISIQDQYNYITIIIPNTLSELKLNPIFNWISFPGGIYNEIQNFYPIVFFLYGLISSSLYKQFISKTIIGLVLYPIFIFSILFWFGDNYLNYPDFIVGIYTVLGIKLLNSSLIILE